MGGGISIDVGEGLSIDVMMNKEQYGPLNPVVGAVAIMKNRLLTYLL